MHCCTRRDRMRSGIFEDNGEQDMENSVDPVFKNEMRISDTTANPGALGLLAFGMTTVILNLHNAGLFGMTAFISYGSFWIVLVFMILMPALGWSDALPAQALAAYLALWGLFSLVMFVITFRLSRALQVVFGLLVLLFLLLVVGISLGSAVIVQIAGIEGIICGLSAMYTGLGEVMNEVYKEKIVRLG